MRLIQAVRHVNHASAQATQITENFEHTLNFIGGETCGWLIQHQYIGFDSESPGDCNKLFFGPAQILQALGLIKITANHGRPI